MKRITVIVLSALAAGCASGPQLTPQQSVERDIAAKVDPISITDQGAYQSALHQCSAMLMDKQSADAGNALASGLIGLVAGAAVGTMLHSDRQTVQFGALAGGLGWAGASGARGLSQQDQLAYNCMSNRGYKMLF